MASSSENEQATAVASLLSNAKENPSLPALHWFGLIGGAVAKGCGVGFPSVLSYGHFVRWARATEIAIREALKCSGDADPAVGRHLISVAVDEVLAEVCSVMTSRPSSRISTR